MSVVYAPGVWDLLHVGHVRFLDVASHVGEKLIVGVPSDDVVFNDKGQLPVIPLNERMEMLAALECVDHVEAYYELDFIVHLEKFRPRILAVGAYWGSDLRHTRAENWLAENGGWITRIPYTNFVSTTDIIKRIQERIKT